MNMPAMKKDQQTQRFIDTSALPQQADNDDHGQAMLINAKGFLDKVFPLARGSHKDVRSYVVYYQHLLAYFEDGSHSGLAEPSQFVALSGHKDDPSSIVLKNNGFHLELTLDRNGINGIEDPAHIDDIQVEIGLLTSIEPNHTLAGAEQQLRISRNWSSLIRGDGATDMARKAFTAKDGEDYRLHGLA